MWSAASIAPVTTVRRRIVMEILIPYAVMKLQFRDTRESGRSMPGPWALRDNTVEVCCIQARVPFKEDHTRTLEKRDEQNQ